MEKTTLAAATDLSADIAAAFDQMQLGSAPSFLLEHPVATVAVAALTLYLAPRIVEAFIRYLALPVAIALVAFYALEFPEESATAVTTFLQVINDNPSIASVIIIGLAIFGLIPALTAAFGAAALVYCLLSLSFGTQVPEVKEMQGTFGQTVSNVRFASQLAYQRLNQLLLK
ncbi:hypothetical protein HYH03_017456 [Edaphochlamys debaryana]|uniref:Uncharacterized protein n=1 Tax=Edaphochlamys debaryana TaxID=47281 RepID=A0A835XIY6_9CHLO|nr:hypothetical protein HYH03_017456 [Edaphochlamys debaryana]|eukprot:KAG2483653.1 hypothetical protein HYH03_017456 [Edaphochlamys debaryana]